MNTILITGTNRGIGLELVKQYSEDNWQVIAGVRSLDTATELNKLAKERKNISVIKLDVANSKDIQQLGKFVENISIDILFNNAGVWGPVGTEFGTVEVKPWLDVFHVNAIAPLMISQALITQIARSKLKIIANMSSSMGSIGDNTSGGEYIYRSSKAALNAVTKTMAVDLKEQNIKVVALHPSWVQTDMGGPDALITPTESVRGIKQVLNSISFEDSGSFIRYNGTRIEW